MALVPRTNTVGQTPAGTLPGGFAARSESVGDMGASAWRAAQGAGEQLQRTGDMLSQQAIQAQNLENETHATEAVTGLSRALNEEWARYSELQGTAATAGYEPFVQRVRGIAETTLGTTDNPRVRQMLAGRVNQMTESLIGGAATWRVRQGRVASVQASEGAAAEALAVGLRDRDSPQGMERALAQGLSEIQKIGEISGWDEATLRARQAEYRGRYHSTMIDSVMNTDPLRAQRMFDAVRNDMDAASQLRMEDRLRAPVRARRGADIVASVTTPAGGSVRDMIFRAENPAGDARRNPMPGQTASGPGQITDGTWAAYAPRLGLQPGQRNDRAAQEAIFDAYMEDAKREVGRDLSPGEQYAAWLLGIGGAKAFIMAPRDANAREVYGTVASRNVVEQAFRYNGSLLRDNMTVGQVLDAVTSRVGARGSSGDRGDHSAMLTAALRQAGDDPDLQAEVMSQFSRWQNTLNATQAQDRAAMERRVNDLGRSLDLGSEASIPAAEIRRLFQPEQADRILDDLNTRQVAGQVFRSVQLASPEDLHRLRQDLQTGTGEVSQLLRLRRGTRTDAAGNVLEEDRAGDVVARGAMSRVLDERIQERNRLRDADQAQFVLADPTVRAAAEAAASGDPAAMAAYVTATRAAQMRIGVAEADTRILSRQQAQAIAGDIMRTDVAAGTPENPQSPVLRLRVLERTYGEAWPAVFADLTRDGRLAPEYQVLANISSTIGQTDFANMLAAQRQAGGTSQFREAVRRNAPAEEAQLGRTASEYLEPFVRTATASGQRGGDALAATVGNSVENLAAYYVNRGMSASAALQRATDRILNDKYEFQGTMRVPRVLPNGQPLGLRPVMQAQAVVMNELKPEDLAEMPDLNDGVPADRRREVAWRSARDGFWVPNERDTGLVLMRELENGGRVPVRRADQGRVEILYNALPRASLANVLPPQRDSATRGVTRIEGFDDPQPGEAPAVRSPAARPGGPIGGAPAGAVLPGERTGRSSRQPARGTWVPPQ